MKFSESKIRSLIKVTGRAQNTNSLYGICPWCGHNEFGISLEKDHLFNCFRKKKCGVQGNIFDLLKKLKISVSKDQIKEPITEKIRRLEQPRENTSTANKQTKIPLFKRIYSNQYLKGRGFIESDFENYEVGTSTIYKDYVIFIIRDKEKNIVGHVARSIHPKIYCENNGILRYKNSSSSLSNHLYKVGDISETTILVEGIFDKIAVDRKLGLPCCSTLGAKISDRQIELLLAEGCQEVVICFDGDVRSVIERSSKKLLQYFKITIMIVPSKDPDEASKEELLESFANRQSFFNFTVIKRLS